MQREHATYVQFESFALATDEALGSGLEDELYWLGDDAEAALSELQGQGSVSLLLKQMPFGKVFGIEDPDGRTRYLLELAKDRPSRAVS